MKAIDRHEISVVVANQQRGRGGGYWYVFKIERGHDLGKIQLQTKLNITDDECDEKETEGK